MADTDTIRIARMRELYTKNWTKRELVQEVIDLNEYVKRLLERLHPEDY